MFYIYTPIDLGTHSWIAIVCRRPHNHPPPEPCKTPEPYRRILYHILQGMGRRLAGASCLGVSRDPQVIALLRGYLNWPSESLLDPTLIDLHPSLANLDHLEYLIKIIKSRDFPDGMGWKGSSFSSPIILICT